MIKKFRQKELLSNYSRNLKSFVKFISISALSHCLIKETAKLKSHRDITKIKFYNKIIVFKNRKNANDFEKIIKKYDLL